MFEDDGDNVKYDYTTLEKTTKTKTKSTTNGGVKAWNLLNFSQNCTATMVVLSVATMLSVYTFTRTGVLFGLILQHSGRRGNMVERLGHILVVTPVLCEVFILSINVCTLCFLFRRYHPSGRAIEEAGAALDSYLNITARHDPEAVRPIRDVVLYIWNSEAPIFHFNYSSIVKFVIGLIVGSVLIDNMYRWPNDTMMNVCLVTSCVLWITIGAFICWKVKVEGQLQKQNLDGDGMDSSDHVNGFETNIV